MRPFSVAILALFMLAVAACQTGQIAYDNPQTGERVRVSQAPKAIAPATLRRGSISVPQQPPPIEISTGEAQERDYATEAQTSLLTWLGAGLILAGVVGLILSRTIPVIPVSGSALAILAGVGVLMIPGLLQQRGLCLAILAAVVATVAVGWWSNHHKPPASPPGPQGSPGAILAALRPQPSP